MRAASLSFIAILLALSFGISAEAQSSGSTTFTANLFPGVSSPQVVALQKILNESPDTRIASAGPGSPGNETPYFGTLTKAAVIRFQQKYASQVLTPAGLTQATGFVGAYTRSLLNAFAQIAAQKASASTAGPVTTPTTDSPPLVTASTTSTQSPGIATLDSYIAAVNALGTKQGMSSNTLTTLDADLRQEMATSSNTVLQQFFNQQQTMYEKQQVSTDIMASPISALLQDLSQFTEETFLPQKAYAQVLPTGWAPFGGFITFIVPCTCDPVVDSIFVALAYPNPVVTNLLLNYVLGTEGFNWHNIPEPGIATLGLYVPGAGEACFIGFEPFCAPLPTEGLILPITGSSLTPG
jgi:peptidoglycan hydrolase-like protein with peptidoglycan-binding domain